MRSSLPIRIAGIIVTTFLLLKTMAGAADSADHDARPRQWGNVTYLNLGVGESLQHQGHTVTLVTVHGRDATVRLDGTDVDLTMARRGLPVTVNGLQLFLAVTRPVAEITTNRAFPLTHAFLTGDVVLGVADAARPLLDPARYAFPIDRSDGFVWTMEEDSHMFAYLTPDRAHEGIDIDLTGARRTGRHRLQAIENGTVRWISPGPVPQVCLLIESGSQPGIYYLYQHVDRDHVLVATGERVTRGQPLGHIWGDNRWAHLHFSVIASGRPPDYATRYQYVLNAFPQLYGLWRGAKPVESGPVRTQGEFVFADPYWEHGNRQHLSAYEALLGYGWRLDAGEPTAKVPNVQQTDEPLTGRSALLGHVLHANNPAHAPESQDSYTFEAAVMPGRYRVEVQAGHGHVATAQRILAEGKVMAEWRLEADDWREAALPDIAVDDGQLTITVQLTEPDRPASLKAVRFERVGD